MSEELRIATDGMGSSDGGGGSVPGTPVPSKFKPKAFASAAVSVVVLGGSGDLAKKKTLPALYGLFLRGLLPPDVVIMGYARSSIEDYGERLTPYLEKVENSNPDSLALFLAQVHYTSGQYDSQEDFGVLHSNLVELEDAAGAGDSGEAHRVFYLALPPKVFATVSSAFSPVALSERGWNRVVVEKPFGRDLDSSNELGAALAECFDEDMMYRIDHYLGKSMALNMSVLRNANLVFAGAHMWNRNVISSVTISFKEPFGTEGRAGYFDEIGIVRDVMQNHLLQMLALVAMERPVDLDAESIRDEKVKVLRSIKPITLDDILIGQYVGTEDGSKPGYKDEDDVPNESKTATFAIACFYINNERWAGVPFIIRCGKALNERKANIRIQMREVPGGLYGDAAPPNELVFRIQPDEAIYLKINAKKPGLSDEIVQTELDLSYKTRFNDADDPTAYERLLFDVLRGDRSHFVRSDELEAAWKIFDDVLHQLDNGELDPIPYVYGSRGPPAADDFVADRGYIHSAGYSWSASVPAIPKFP